MVKTQNHSLLFTDNIHYPMSIPIHNTKVDNSEETYLLFNTNALNDNSRYSYQC